MDFTILFLCDRSSYVIFLFVTQVTIQRINYSMDVLRGIFKGTKDPFTSRSAENIYRYKFITE